VYIVTLLSSVYRGSLQNRNTAGIENLENTLKKAKKIVFLTGGWISQESGISTFRGKDGLWQKYDPMKLASAQASEMIQS